tara:strand:+ start:558 stop:809 length:252 start_codon:yes stop_codon:yes gene_type:complete
MMMTAHEMRRDAATAATRNVTWSMYMLWSGHRGGGPLHDSIHVTARRASHLVVRHISLMPHQLQLDDDYLLIYAHSGIGLHQQ